MKSADDVTTPRKVRMDLRYTFGWTLYIASGMAIGSAISLQDEEEPVFDISISRLNWGHALLGAASAAVAVGLVRQSRSLGIARREVATSVRTSLLLEATLRLGLAVVIAVCLIVQLLVAREIIELPNGEVFILYADVLTGYVWWSALFIALCDALVRTRRPTVTTTRWPIVDGLIWIGVSAAALYVAVDFALISFLVHIACRGVNAARTKLPEQYAINDQYPITALDDELLIFTTAGLATAAIFGLVTIACRILPAFVRGDSFSRWLALLGGGLLCASAFYLLWYHSAALPYYAPDTSFASIGATWYQKLGGVILFVVAVTYAAYRLWHASEHESSCLASVALPGAVESISILSLLVAANLLLVVQLARGMLNSGFVSPAEGFAYLLELPDTYLNLGVLLFSLRLLRLHWRRRVPAPLTIVPLRLGRLAIAWLMLAALLSTAVGTISAFSFSYWLGPWYR